VDGTYLHLLVTTGLNDLQINKEKKFANNICLEEESLPLNLEEEYISNYMKKNKQVKILTHLLFPFIKLKVIVLF